MRSVREKKIFTNYSLLITNYPPILLDYVAPLRDPSARQGSKVANKPVLRTGIFCCTKGGLVSKLTMGADYVATLRDPFALRGVLQIEKTKDSFESYFLNLPHCAQINLA